MTENISSPKTAVSVPETTSLPAPTIGASFMMSPRSAWRLLCARTGGDVTLMTFYRWLKNGKVYSIRLGYRIFVPRSSVEDLIKQCLAGERS
jgi:hypothetical protein